MDCLYNGIKVFTGEVIAVAFCERPNWFRILFYGQSVKSKPTIKSRCYSHETGEKDDILESALAVSVSRRYPSVVQDWILRW